MFDTFQGHQFLKKFPFSFQPSRFEIWENGEMVKKGNTSSKVKADIKQTFGDSEVVSLNISDPALFNDISNSNTFDTVFTLHDRIILATIPEPSNKDNVGIMSLRATTGITRKGKVFNSNEPFCCSLFLTDKRISKVTFSFSNPEKLIEFYYDDRATNQNPAQEVEVMAEKVLSDVKNEQLNSARQKMLQLFATIKANPSVLSETRMPDKLGKAFVLMLINRISSDDDTIEAIACIAYVLISKAIHENPNPNLYLERLLIMEFSREEFNYSIRLALDVSEGGSIDYFSPVGQMGGTKARDGIFKMEIADLYSNPALYQQVDLFRRKKTEFDIMIADNFFYNKTLNDLITEGNANHEKAYRYFHNKILVNHDIAI
jgi:hypothetical protein